MSRTSRRCFKKGYVTTHRSMDWAGQRAYENARADLAEAGVRIPKYPCPNAWDDLMSKALDELPKHFWARDDVYEWMQSWARKRKTPHKGGASIRGLVISD